MAKLMFIKTKKKIIVFGFTLLSLLLVSSHSFAQCQYLSPEEIIELQDSLTTHFPDICKKVTIGTSVTGYDIIALKFSDNVNVDEPEPEVLLTFCIHGDENFPEQVGAKLCRKLCLDYNSDPQTTNLINNREIWVIIVMNPDGLRGINDFNRPNANGVDLNRNSGYMWYHDDGATQEWTEPETKAYRGFLLSRNFNISIDYHAGLQGIIYPWFYRGDDCPDNQEITYLANQYKAVSGYPADGFEVTSGFNLYQTFGSLAEFAYGSLGIYAYAVELNTFPDIIYNSCQLITMNKPAIYTLIQKAGEGVSGIITDATTANPIKAKISITGRVPSYSSNIGDYHRFLKAGTYTVTVSANGYLSKTKTITVNDGSLTTEDFQLTPSGNYSAQKIITCRNNNNTNDPAKTWNALGMNDGAYYALGDTGYVVLDMGMPVVDVSGNDITIYGDASGSNNQFELFYSGSIDGPWTSLGTGTTTKSFDLNGASNVRYFKLEDNGIGTGNVLDAGFHLDAITAVELSMGIDNTTLSKNDIADYPNPTADIIYFKGGETDKIDMVSIFDISGKLVIQEKFSNKIDLSSFISGVYFVQLHTNRSLITYKIIKK